MNELRPGDSPEHLLAPWFDFKRRERAARYANREPDPDRRAAVITIVHNEPVFFPVWLRYYSRYFAEEDIYVLDHDTDDGSTAVGGFVHLPVSHELFDNRWMVGQVERLQRELLERYDVVVVCDVDEIIAPDPGWGDLRDYVARFDEEWVNCLGYEVMHDRGEPPYDPGRPVLAQRRRWFANDAYDKPSISTVPLSYRPGFHRRADDHFNFDPDLRLIHLHRLDMELTAARHAKWTSRTWEETDLTEGWGTHNRVVGEEFASWFYADAEGEPLRLEEIPERWRGLI